MLASNLPPASVRPRCPLCPLWHFCVQPDWAHCRDRRPSCAGV